MPWESSANIEIQSHYTFIIYYYALHFPFFVQDLILCFMFFLLFVFSQWLYSTWYTIPSESASVLILPITELTETLLCIMSTPIAQRTVRSCSSSSQKRENLWHANLSWKDWSTWCTFKMSNALCPFPKGSSYRKLAKSSLVKIFLTYFQNTSTLPCAQLTSSLLLTFGRANSIWFILKCSSIFRSKQRLQHCIWIWMRSGCKIRHSLQSTITEHDQSNQKHLMNAVVWHICV